MDQLNAGMHSAPKRPVRVLQFGEGNFLRAFVDYMIDIANEKTGMDAGIVLIKPIPQGSLGTFHAQNFRYTVLLRGLENGVPVEKTRLITSVQDAVDAYTEYDRYAAYAKLPSLRFVVSNTTEAGIVLNESDRFDLCPPMTFPGKLCKFLYERAEAFGYAPDKGLVMLPVELIDDNGIELKRCVKALARLWNLGDRFEIWLDTTCVFTSTLVDRIVTGYPRDEAEAIFGKLGYTDRLLVTGEPFALWVIESRKDISQELPLPACGLPVIFTGNQKPYKQRKVRILNGAHTGFVPAAFLCGYDDVRSAMGDPMIKAFAQEMIREEVIPTLTLPQEELEAFAQAVFTRFENPFIRHALLDICLNSVSKWRARCLPSLTGYAERQGKLPQRLAFSLAALTSLYYGGTYRDGVLECSREGKPYPLRDDESVLRFFSQSRGKDPAEVVDAFLSNREFFGMDLHEVEGLAQSVKRSLSAILLKGMRAAMSDLMEAQHA